MKKLRKRVFVTAGYNTISFGSGRKEFHPKKPMPKIEDYLKETAEGTLKQLPNPEFDEGVIGNFMAGRFIKQAHLAAFLPFMVPNLKGKPCIRVEGACASGGLSLATGIRSILTGLADSVFVTGFEIQNSMKAVYGADVLAAASYFNGERKDGHAFFFPEKFSARAGAYYKKYDAKLARQGMAKWYELAITNARKNPKAQEYHNSIENPYEAGMTAPNPKTFCEHINFFDCSKVSDGAASLIVTSELGLEKIGVKKEDAIEVVGFALVEGDITETPSDLSFLENTALATHSALARAGVGRSDIGILELHDCFSISGIIALEAAKFTTRGNGARFVLDGETSIEGSIPTNLSGGLCGYGHPVGATGVRQAVDILEQLTGRAPNQAKVNKDFGMMVNMGGNDKTLVSVIFKRN